MDSGGQHRETDVAATATARRAVDWSMLPIASGSGDSVVVLALQRARREPALLFTTAYLLVSLLGLWCSFWFYRGFGLSILDYLQASDFLVAGIRDPVYMLLLALGVFIVLLCSWPETLRLRNASQIEQLKARSIVWRLVLSRSMFTSWESTGLRPWTAMTLAVALFMAANAAWYVTSRGERIRAEGIGEMVSVQLTGDTAALPGNARLLGSSSAYVFLWWPEQRRAEAVPIAAVRRLQSQPVHARAAKAVAEPTVDAAVKRPAPATPPVPDPSAPAAAQHP